MEAAPSPGSERVACVRVGFPGTREASSSPSYRPPGGGHRLTTPEAVDVSTWRPTERSRRCSDGTAGRRQRSAGGWTARSRRVSEYRRSGGIEPTRPRGGKGAPAGGTGGGKDGQHTEVGSRLHVTTTDSRTGQTSLGDGGGHRLASWTSGYATARSEAVCRGAGCGRTRTSGSVGGQGQQRPWSTRPVSGNARCDASRRQYAYVQTVRVGTRSYAVSLSSWATSTTVEAPPCAPKAGVRRMGCGDVCVLNERGRTTSRRSSALSTPT